MSEKEKEEKAAELRRDDRMFRTGMYPENRPEYKTLKVLDVSLTDAEFAAVKKAVLSVM